MSRIKHVDGLRAAAIIPVVLYHAFPSNFPNGYLGVDYFLVISGFVIAKKYFVDPEINFSFREFWSKRITRLYPQLLTCIALCTPIAWFVMHPDHLENFSQSAIASLLGANNFLLYFTGGYWNLANDLKPLFITWSLGLEEQFYLIIAIAFTVSQSHMKTKITQKIFLIAFLCSIIASGFGAFFFRTANYLLIPTRFWEFALGIYAAFLARARPKWITNWLTNLSLFVVLAISLLFPFKTALFAPNPLFLIPLSAISIICISDNKSLSTRILSNRALVYVGLSSYAIYLYHQPLLAFARLQSINDLGTSTLFVLVLGSFLIGFSMYELIEKRKIFKLFGWMTIDFLRSKNLLIASALIGLINVPIVLNNGFFSLRFPYMLVDGQPPLGFLGGKGYTDRPYVYESKKFPDKVLASQDQKNIHISNIYFEGNSKTRDLINALEIVDSDNPKVKFYYSYNFPKDSEDYQKILHDADLVIKQIWDSDDEVISIDDKILLEYSNVSEKVIWHKSRERFAQNMTPIMFISDIEDRANFKYSSIDSYFCSKDNVFTAKFTPEGSGIGIIDTQCAFNDEQGLKTLTSSKGELYSFDGVHLTFAGANNLARALMASQDFKNIVGL